MGKNCSKGFETAVSGIEKGPSVEHIRKQSQMVQTPAYKYARAFCSEVLGIDETDHFAIEDRIYMAEPKSEASINRKARDNYGGDSTRITDGARLTIFTRSPKELKEAMKVFGSNMRQHNFNKDIQRRSGYTHHHDPRDFITNPKRWGYMALYLTIEYDGTPFEVQIYPESMKATYDKTHKLYEAVRGSLENWEQKSKHSGKPVPIDSVLTAGEIEVVKEILELHKIAAKEAGLLPMVKTKFPEFDDLPALIKEPEIEQYPQDRKTPSATHRPSSSEHLTYDA
ncbi:MAG: hypothetical protein ACK4VI_00070 [Alphaproteobacteria bacterium]